MPATLLTQRPLPHGGPHDFDFLVGRWTIQHRRLQKRLADCDTWDHFDGTCVNRPILSGLGNVDDNVLELPSGTYEAIGLRQFDASARRWSIWWMDARHPGIEPPVTGGFEDGVGLFYGDDTLDGRPFLCRFSWFRTDTDTPRWEQAFSIDGGVSWETNWIMTFERAS
jgi:hypothetical protein